MEFKATKKLSDLKDSQILYEKELPLFGYMIMLVVVFLLITVLSWSLVAKKQYVIKSEGIVESTNKNHVMSQYTGKIISSNIREGMNVDIGDILVTVKSDDIELQLQQLKAQKNKYKLQVSQLIKLEKSFKDNINYFDDANSKDSLYYNQYEAYKSQVSQQVVDVAMLKDYGYSKEQIDLEIQKSEGKRTELYHTALKEVGETLLQAKNELGMVKEQQKALANGQANYQVKANEAGKIHMIQPCKKGMVVQATTPIASIASENENYVIQAYITAADRARISVGKHADIEVAGLVQSVYGTVRGEVIAIDSDITTNGEDKQSFFKITVKPDIDYLISKTGNKVDISNGMAVEARIVYDELSYFDYVLESLGILVRQ